MKKKKGFAAILALVIITAILITSTAILAFSSNSLKTTVDVQNTKQLRYMAESGIEEGIAYLKNEASKQTSDKKYDELVPITSPKTINFDDITSDTDKKQNFTDISCKIIITNNTNVYNIVSNASKNGSSYKITADIDISDSFMGNDYINDVGCKTITAIDSMNSTSSAIKVKKVNTSDKVNIYITGSTFIQGKSIIMNLGNNETFKVNNTDRKHSGDSKLKLGSDLNVNLKDRIDTSESKWYGDFNNNKDDNFKDIIIPLSLKQKELLSVIPPVIGSNPLIIDTDKDGDNDLLLWNVPHEVPAFISGTNILDFDKIKNYIINQSGVFNDYIVTAGSEYNTYIPGNSSSGKGLGNEIANANQIEKEYKNLYKVIVVNGDLDWKQPDWSTQFINWVVYCDGTITFSSDYNKSSNTYICDNSNCSFIAKNFVFDNTISGGNLVFSDSFCNLKESQKKCYLTTALGESRNGMYEFLKKNLVDYYNGLDVRICSWKEEAD